MLSSESEKTRSPKNDITISNAKIKNHIKVNESLYPFFSQNNIVNNIATICNQFHNVLVVLEHDLGL